MSLNQCKDVINQAFKDVFNTEPDVQVDEVNKRLVINGRWAMGNKKTRQWMDVNL